MVPICEQPVTSSQTILDVPGYAQLQAALTHGHPTALAAFELAAKATGLRPQGPVLADLLGRLTEHAHNRR